MRTIIAAVLTAGLSLPAAAEVIDLSTRTCQQFQQSDKEEIKIILTWIDGYYKDEKDPPIIDTDKFVENAKKLGQYCTANPTVGLITAAEKLFGK